MAFEDADDDEEPAAAPSGNEILNSIVVDYLAARAAGGPLRIPQEFRDYFPGYILRKFDNETLEDQRSLIDQMVRDVAGHLSAEESDSLLAWRASIENEVQEAILAGKRRAEEAERQALQARYAFEREQLEEDRLKQMAAEALMSLSRSDDYGLRSDQQGGAPAQAPLDIMRLERARSEALRLPGLTGNLDPQGVIDYRECFMQACMGTHPNSEFYESMFPGHPWFMTGVIGAEYENLLQMYGMNFQQAVANPEYRSVFNRHPAFGDDSERPRDIRFAEEGLRNQQRIQNLEQQVVNPSQIVQEHMNRIQQHLAPFRQGPNVTAQEYDALQQSANSLEAYFSGNVLIHSQYQTPDCVEVQQQALHALQEGRTFRFGAATAPTPTPLPFYPIPGFSVQGESVPSQAAGRESGPRRGTFSGGNQLSQAMAGRGRVTGPRPASMLDPPQNRVQGQDLAHDEKAYSYSNDVDMDDTNLYDA